VYIVSGNSRRGVTWGSGNAVAQALAQCRKGGYRCNNPIGGCID
jgi:hypothetical protein